MAVKKIDDDEWFEETDEKVFTFKQKVHNWLKEAQEATENYLQRLRSKSSTGSKSSRRISSSNSSRSRALKGKVPFITSDKHED